MLPDISVTDLSPGESSGDKDGPYFNRRVPSLWCRDLGRRLAEVIENNPQAHVLGTSATPVRPEGMIDTVDLYFEGNLFYELTLPQVGITTYCRFRSWCKALMVWTTS